MFHFFGFKVDKNQFYSPNLFLNLYDQKPIQFTIYLKESQIFKINIIFNPHPISRKKIRKKAFVSPWHYETQNIRLCGAENAGFVS